MKTIFLICCIGAATKTTTTKTAMKTTTTSKTSTKQTTKTKTTTMSALTEKHSFTDLPF